MECFTERQDTAGAPHLGHESATGSQGSPDPGDDPVRLRDPVQRGIAEDGVELTVEGELAEVGDPGIETALERRPDLFGAAVHRAAETAGPAQARGERPVAAAEVEHALTGKWFQQIHDRRTQVRDEARVLVVGVRIPPLGHESDRGESSSSASVPV